MPDQILFSELNYSVYTICYFACTVKSLRGPHSNMNLDSHNRRPQEESQDVRIVIKEPAVISIKKLDESK